MTPMPATSARTAAATSAGAHRRPRGVRVGCRRVSGGGGDTGGASAMVRTAAAIRWCRSSLIEMLPQDGQRPVQQRLHGSAAATERSGDLGFWKIEVVAQEDSGALTDVQAQQRRPYGGDVGGRWSLGRRVGPGRLAVPAFEDPAAYPRGAPRDDRPPQVGHRVANGVG